MDNNTEKAIVKQHVNNGFGKHPENINRAGRPKKWQAITDVIKEYLDGEVENRLDGFTRKEAFARVVYDMAMNGDVAAMKLIMNYIDGQPLQKIISENTNKNITVTVTTEEEKLLGQTNTETDNSNQEHSQS
jgi:hypothetical protein